MIKAVRTLASRLEEFRTEEQTLLRFMSRFAPAAGQRVLDVGCGFGRNLMLLTDLGYSVVGVEANEAIARTVVRSGRTCLTPEQFGQTSDLFDIMLMSHVIEHFQPDELLRFLDGYLERLKTGGCLVIATPLLSPYFYDDFDHVKPYSPFGIAMVFGGSGAQVKYYAKNRLELVDLWYRRAPLRLVNYRGRVLGGQYHLQIFNVLLNLIFRLTGRRAGRCDGWMGLYRKMPGTQ